MKSRENPPCEVSIGLFRLKPIKEYQQILTVIKNNILKSTNPAIFVTVRLKVNYKAVHTFPLVQITGILLNKCNVSLAFSVNPREHDLLSYQILWCQKVF